jgi:aspartyl-tRNA(Asn)/glutamyl-tRNA(Gln) amidotransferase subunit B
MSMAGYETIIGLEVHCELKTETKLFCGCRNAFGDEPNTNVCPVCVGLPGSLPVLNQKAVEFAIRIGLALNCEVKWSNFHRKNYFYPDMPKDFQISQYDLPLNEHGAIELPDGTVVGITRAHMEEDTGKSTHLGESGRIHGADASLIDYNRSGVPLVEIVSEPDMRSGVQARAYVAELRAILVAVGATDGRMEEGSMRVDANVSVRKPGDPFGTRCEIKNLNSLRSLQRAIEYEALRQVDCIEAGERIVQETRHWDESAGRTGSMRSKEEANDYRYFPEPDLVPLAPSAGWIEEIRSALPALPKARRQVLVGLIGNNDQATLDLIATVVDRDLDALVVEAASAGAPAQLAVTRAANELNAEGVLPSAKSFAATCQMEASGALSATQAKAVLAALSETPDADPKAIAASLGFEQLSEDTLSTTVDEVISANGDEWARFAGGDDKLAQFFIGKVMAATKGKANGKAVISLLNERRSG